MSPFSRTILLTETSVNVGWVNPTAEMWTVAKEFNELVELASNYKLVLTLESDDSVLNFMYLGAGLHV